MTHFPRLSTANIAATGNLANVIGEEFCILCGRNIRISSSGTASSSW